MKNVYEQVDKMCVKCGGDLDKYGTFGLQTYMVDAFFHHAYDMDLWDRVNQMYLQPYLPSTAED